MINFYFILKIIMEGKYKKDILKDHSILGKDYTKAFLI